MKPQLLLPVIALFASTAWPHPMGNSSVSHYSRIELTPSGAKIRYVLDLAEIPTAEMAQRWGADYLQRVPAEQAAEWGRGLKVEVAGRRVEPILEQAKADRGPDNLRVEMDFRVDVAPSGSLRYEDTNYPDRSGWKEIVIGNGPDRSRELTAYPAGALASAPQELAAGAAWPGAPTESPAPSADYLARILREGELSWGMLLTALAVAFGAGAVHALSPGHGKTIVAAYLVGTRGTPKHAIFLGGMVTFTHTISVFGLGLTTLFLSHYVLPEKIYPVLGAISGISIVWIGAALFFKRLRAATGRSKPHHHHHHHHGGLVHDHGDGHYHSHVPEGDVSMASLIALGASGGLVPCPSALVLLLSSVALGRVALGLTLLVAFSLGLALVLMAIGLIVLYAKHLLPDRETTARSPFFRYVPVASAGLITIIGALMTGVALGVIRPLPGA